MPEVSLVAILDADKEGFLRSARSLIQTSGRAARNVRGRVILYADVVTRSMQACIDETLRRRSIQSSHNEAHGIEPRSIVKRIRDTGVPEEVRAAVAPAPEPLPEASRATPESLEADIASTRDAMREAAKALEFERAAELRDRLRALEAMALGLLEGA
jgi:excinuclease ABC subunit B